MLACGENRLGAQDLGDLGKQVRDLQRQNEQFQQQLLEQQRLIEKLNQKLSTFETSEQGRSNQIQTLQNQVKELPPASDLLTAPFKAGNVIFSGEGGAAFIHQSPVGEFQHAQFLLDEAKLFFDAKLWKDVYFFSEINLVAREQQQGDDNLHMGEIYVDFENVSGLWGQERLVNIRAGRFYIPFGEEYQSRFVIDDPLISHSVTDIWGVDQGLELYGSKGKFNYVIAVQNGGNALFSGFNSDKAVVGRMGYEPAKWLRLSASAMRTGGLDVKQDQLSALWFGTGFFSPIGSGGTTTFHADLAEGDIQFRWSKTQLKGFGGAARYGDNDPAADNSRDIYYYSIEGIQNLSEKLYAAGRFGQIFAPKGYPIAGGGDFVEYALTPGNLTTELVRLSLGLGYHWSPNLVLKAEYTLEWGQLANGVRRDYEHMAGIELGFKF